MSTHLSDEQAQARIEELELEERRLRSEERDAAEHNVSDRVAADRERLAAVKIELDQLWDYLHQRRAFRDAGQDPNQARLRDADTVEKYLG
ncbi:MAG TPA: DUF2630 family protein [Solirubrobacteraceae bacterium]|jgi:hypothetical protein|nr:DUF2630 family protein [Solirubrobacteraceae bacterium]